ncbi:MAG: hypothetical protein STHCBS139747_000327 [Sporothrix thermara]
MAAAPAAEQTVPTGPATAAEFEAFDSFPWSKHRVFLLGLIETLGGPEALRPNPTHEGSSVFCRTVFFRRQTGRRVDLTRYNGFRAERPEYPSIDQRLLHALYTAAASLDAELGLSDLSLSGASANSSLNPLASPSTNRNRRLAEAVAAGPLINPFDGSPAPVISNNSSSSNSVDVPSWQRSAPRNELKIDRTLARGGSAGAGGAGAAEAPYSDKFAKVVEAIQSGKELEGIKQIPDTVVRQPGITPMGKLQARKKPWERAASASPVASALSFIDGALTPTDQEAGNKQLGIGRGEPLVDLEFPEPIPSPLAEPEDGNAEEKKEVKE